MLRVIREILALLWKALKLLVWNRLKRVLGRLFLYTLLLVAAVTALVVLTR